ncbi:MAG TPA: hypothetical protein VF007_11415 [Stellaceae bacterium]
MSRQLESAFPPGMLGRKAVPVPPEELVEDTIRMFLRRYRRCAPALR